MISDTCGYVFFLLLLLLVPYIESGEYLRTLPLLFPPSLSRALDARSRESSSFHEEPACRLFPRAPPSEQPRCVGHLSTVSPSTVVSPRCARHALQASGFNALARDQHHYWRVRLSTVLSSDIPQTSPPASYELTMNFVVRGIRLYNRIYCIVSLVRCKETAKCVFETKLEIFLLLTRFTRNAWQLLMLPKNLSGSMKNNRST